jgi:two-component system NtrC family sensor kinase
MKTSEMITKQFATLDHMPVGAFVLQKNFVVVFWNSRLEDWTGITRDKIVGEPIEMYFPHLKATKYFVRIQDVFNTGMPFIFSSYLHKYLIPVILPNNQIQIQSTTVTRVPDLNGRNYYVIFSIQDVTELTHRIRDYRIMRDQAEKEVKERKQAQTELMAAHNTLKETLETLQKTQTQLVESEKMAALGQLVAGIAHEINSPLGAIRSSIENISHSLNQTLQELPGFFQVLSEERQYDFFVLLGRSQHRDLMISPREERKYRRKLFRVLHKHQVENADKIADILVDMGIYNDIKQFLRLFQDPEHDRILNMAYKLSGLQESAHTIMTATNRASKVVFALRTYSRYDNSGVMTRADITEGIETVLTLYYNQLKHGIEVIRHYEALEPVLCYPDELSQVWTNLLHNALQAMEYKGTLTITVRKQDEQAVISITDTGSGIPDEIKEKIFDPFFTTKAAGEGSGLGLDIVRKIIEKHQGQISFESEPGKTTFHVVLPINVSRNT